MVATNIRHGGYASMKLRQWEEMGIIESLWEGSLPEGKRASRNEI